MKKVCALFLSLLLLCLLVLPVQGTSILVPSTIEEALVQPSDPQRGNACVVIGTMTDEIVDVRMHGNVWRMNVHRVIYGDVTEVNLLQTRDPFNDNYLLPTDEPFLFLLIPIKAHNEDGTLRVENEYHRVGAWYGQFSFINGELRGYQKWVDEILTDDPTIDTMDELAEYFEKRIDALQREGKLPPDPVNWPGILVATGGLAVLGGATAVLVWKRRKAARI